MVGRCQSIGINFILFDMYSTYLQNYLYRCNPGDSYSKTLTHELELTNKQNTFLKQEVVDLLQQNNRLRSELIQQKYHQHSSHDYSLAYSKQLALNRSKPAKKIINEHQSYRKYRYLNPQNHSPEKRHHSHKKVISQKQFNKRNYESAQKPKQIRTFIEELDEQNMKERKIKKIQTEYMYEEPERGRKVKKNNFPYLSPGDREQWRNKELKREENKQQIRAHQEKPRIIQNRESTKKTQKEKIITNRESQKKSEKKHYLSLMGRTFENANQMQLKKTESIRNNQ